MRTSVGGTLDLAALARLIGRRPVMTMPGEAGAPIVLGANL